MRYQFKKNRLLAILLSVVLVLTMLPATAWASAATGWAIGTAGSNQFRVTLTSGSQFSSVEGDVTNAENWTFTSSGVQTITGISKQSDTVVQFTLSGSIEEDNIMTLQAASVVFSDGTEPFASSIYVNVAKHAEGAATAEAGTKDIVVTLTKGAFGSTQNPLYWTLGGTSASENPIYSVRFDSATQVTIRLTNDIEEGDVYTLATIDGAFVNIMTLTFVTPLAVTVNSTITAKLATPGGLAWDTGTPGAVNAIWTEVPNVHQYRVSLYRNGASSPMYMADVTSNSVDFTVPLRAYGPGAYTFTVIARANPVSSYTDSDVSALSSSYTFTPVCMITPTNQHYTTLGEALGAIASGQAITLLQNISLASGIMISEKTIELNLNGKTLSINASGQNGIEVQSEGDLTVSGGGQLDVNVTGAASHGLYVSGTLTIASPCTVSSANGIGVYARSGDIILQNAFVTGSGIGATADDGSVEITGNVAATGGRGSHGVSAYSGGQVEITGSVSADSIGVFVDGAGSQIIVKGNVTVNEADSLGAYAFDSGRAKIDGVITATTYIQVGTTFKTAADKTLHTTETGYHTYTDGISTVWVKDTSSPAPVTPPARIAAGSGHSLFLKEDGTVWAWGSNVNGQLGRGTFTDYSFDVPAQVTGLSNVKSVAAGHVFSLALKNDGTVWAWGTNGNGQLGLPQATTARSHTPIQVAGLSGIQAISAGHRFCLALDVNGDVWAWGANIKGQLGQTAVETIHIPGKIAALSNIVAISAGYEHSLALDADGNVWAWGSNYFGELGNGTVNPTGTHPTPSLVTIPPGLTVSAIYAAFQNSMLTTGTGSVYGWGYNSEGSLGDGTNTHRSVPTITSYSGITALGGTGAFYIALKNDGTVIGSGKNSFMTEIINYGATPVLINGLTEITAVSQGNGGNHALALDEDGNVWAWGSNSSEECSVATFSGEPKKIDPPVQVQFPGGDISAASVTITPPVAGGTPQTAAQAQAATNHVDYSVTGLTWNEAMTAEGKFKAGQVYTATVTLTSKNGKKFQPAAFTPTIAGAASVSQTVTSGSSTGNTVTFTVTYGQTAADPDVQDVAAAVAALNFNTIKGSNLESESITSNLNLTTSGINGTSISWASNKPAYITTGGAVTRPAQGAADEDVTLIATVTKGAASQTKQFTVRVKAQPASTPDNSGPRGGSSTPPPAYKAEVSGTDASGTLPVTVNTGSNNAAVTAGAQQGNSLAEGNPVVIAMPSIPGVASFTLEIPADYLSAPDGEGVLTLTTDTGSVTMPSNMLTNTEGGKAKISISEGDTSELTGDVKAAIGDRPLVQLTLTLDGKQTAWNNPSAPVTVSIPYKPSEEELQDPEHIVIWYIDGAGNAVSVPSGRYDPATGTVTFTTTHFSDYAIAYVHKTFSDLNGVKWAKKAIEVMASKGVTNGTGGSTFSPATGITRADYMVMLIKSLGLTASFEQNFADVPSGVYYYEALGIARELGIATGSGDNLFLPKAKISRQDMMALTARALEKAGKLKAESDTTVLDQFVDKDKIKSYAAESLAALIKDGLITGSGNKLNPGSDTTRAEAAVFLYRIYNR